MKHLNPLASQYGYVHTVSPDYSENWYIVDCPGTYLRSCVRNVGHLRYVRNKFHQDISAYKNSRYRLMLFAYSLHFITTPPVMSGIDFCDYIEKTGNPKAFISLLSYQSCRALITSLRNYPMQISKVKAMRDDCLDRGRMVHRIL